MSTDRATMSDRTEAPITHHRPRTGRVVFLDTETTGLDPATEQLFEIATICGDSGRERVYHLEPDAEVVERMHPKAAEVNRYHERIASPDWKWDSPHHTADQLRRTLTGAHIVGAVPDFDARFLTAWYTHMGQDVPRWHYHLIDIENLAYGWMLREPLTAQERYTLGSLPLDSDALSQMCGVEPVPVDERHTALGDARWVARWWNRLHGHSGRTDRGLAPDTSGPSTAGLPGQAKDARIEELETAIRTHRRRCMGEPGSPTADIHSPDDYDLWDTLGEDSDHE